MSRSSPAPWGMALPQEGWWIGATVRNEAGRALSRFPHFSPLPQETAQFPHGKISPLPFICHNWGGGEEKEEKEEKNPKAQSRYVFQPLEVSLGSRGWQKVLCLIVRCSLFSAHKSTYNVDFLPFPQSPAQ